jgi:hypothetical protein
MLRVPRPRAAVYEDDWEAEAPEDYGDFEDGDEDFEDYGFEPRRPRPASRRTVKKKKKKKRVVVRDDRPSQRARMVAEIWDTVCYYHRPIVYVLAVLFIYLFFLGRGWISYTTPDGSITVQVPSRMIKVTPTHWTPEGADEERYMADHLDYACVISIVPLKPEFKGKSEEEILKTYHARIRNSDVSNLNRTTVNGHDCLTFDQPPEDGFNTSSQAFIYKGKVYTMNYVYKGSRGKAEQRFLGSVQFN